MGMMNRAMEMLLFGGGRLPDFNPYRSVISPAEPSKQRPVNRGVEPASNTTAVAPDGRRRNWPASLKPEPDPVICVKAGFSRNTAAIDGQVKQLGVMAVIGVMPNGGALQYHGMAQGAAMFDQCRFYPAIS